MEYEDPNMDGGAIELQIIKKEDLEELAHIWTQLDDRTRYLLEGHYILNLPAAEMARELNIKLKPACVWPSPVPAKPHISSYRIKADSEGAVHADMLPP
ncbi:hypothetical protein M5E87_17825 [Flavonifractor plautii]|nr:hypothetical protein M5E87_17825 [Flavonifractor plautii]